MLQKLWYTIFKCISCSSSQSTQWSRTLLLFLVCFLLSACKAHKTEVNALSPFDESRGAVQDCSPSWASVSQTSEISAQTGWRDAESSDSCFPAGPGVVLDPPGAPYTPRTSLHHAGELRSNQGEWLWSAVLQVSFPLLCIQCEKVKGRGAEMHLFLPFLD